MAKKALLIIDMQQGDFPPNKARYRADEVVEIINHLSAQVRADGLVVFIQHDGSREGAFIPGTADWELLPQLNRTDADLVVSKTANNAFYQSELHAVLQMHAVNELLITGSATDFCVDATIQGALALDYEVTVVADGHATGLHRPTIDAQEIIDHYNWKWAEFTPTQGKILVKTHTEL